MDYLEENERLCSPITTEKLEPVDRKYWVQKKHQISENHLATLEHLEDDNALNDYEYDTDYEGSILVFVSANTHFLNPLTH